MEHGAFAKYMQQTDNPSKFPMNEFQTKQIMYEYE